MRSIYRAIFTSTVVALAATTCGSAELPPEVRDGLETNAKLLQNVRLSGSMRRRLLDASEPSLLRLGCPPHISDFTQEVMFEILLKGRQMRESLRYPPGKYNSGNGVDQRSFDGKRYYVGTTDPSSKESPGMLMIRSPRIVVDQHAQKASEERLFEFWYLLEAGFNAPTRPADLDDPLRSLVLSRLNAGKLVSVVHNADDDNDGRIEISIEYPEPWASARQASIEDDPFFRGLRAKSGSIQMALERERRTMLGQSRVCRFVLAREMNYAVLEKWEIRGNGVEVMFHTINSEFIEAMQGGPWIPKRSEVISHAYEGGPAYTSDVPLYVTELQLTGVELKEVDDDQFRIWFDVPGTVVADYTHPKATLENPLEYRVPAPDSALERIADDRRPISKFQVVVLINVVILLIAVAIYVRSRRRA